MQSKYSTAIVIFTFLLLIAALRQFVDGVTWMSLVSILVCTITLVRFLLHHRKNSVNYTAPEHLHQVGQKVVFTQYKGYTVIVFYLHDTASYYGEIWDGLDRVFLGGSEDQRALFNTMSQWVDNQ